MKESPVLSPEIQEIVDSGAQIPDIIDAIKQQVAMIGQQEQINHAGAMIAGQVPPPMPPPDPSQIAKASIRVWPTDFHKPEAAKCQDWLSSEACWREQEAKNTRGILNVMLHMMEHEQAEPPEPPPMPMPARRPPPKLAGVGAAPPLPAAAAPNAPGAVQ